MGKKLPLLKRREVEANLKSLGFKHARTKGSHKIYERAADGVRRRAIVEVDLGKDQFDAYLMKMMIRESRLTQEEFCSGVLNEPNLAQKPVTEGGKNA
ncbi:MAG: type II toxin-antitoxin system HicA family toxin [Terracidiphilus sp.]|jgi:predicted RNA binding protein YcfA (HicA-like mRNA interferase family)